MDPKKRLFHLSLGASMETSYKKKHIKTGATNHINPFYLQHLPTQQDSQLYQGMIPGAVCREALLFTKIQKLHYIA